MKFIFTVILFFGLAFGEVQLIGDKKNTHNLSIGFLDDKTGLSLIGYTYNLKKTDMDEYFIGVGTMIVAYTATVGYKHYYRKSKVSFSSVFCGQFVAHLGFIGWMSTASSAIEYNFSEWGQLKLGSLGMIILTGDNIGDIGILPFLGLNFQF